MTALPRGPLLALALILPLAARGAADDAYWRWAVEKFGHASASNPSASATLWGENADPDQDQIPNLLEYASDTDPQQSNPLSDCYTYELLPDSIGTYRPKVTAMLRVDDPDLRVLCQTSPNLNDWLPEPPSDPNQPLPANPHVYAMETGGFARGLRQMTYLDALNTTNRPTAFMRLHVTRRGVSATSPGIEPFSFTTLPSVAPGSIVRSNSVVLAGFTGSFTIDIPAGASLYVNGVVQPGPTAVVRPGDILWMEAVAPQSSNESSSRSLNVGSYSAAWMFSTGSIPEVPDHPGADSGYTPVESGVSETGAAQISIPIVVSPGTAGMQPKLSVNYSSQGGNGPLGMGFSLGGLSAINRIAPTLAQDGIKGGIAFNANDRYSFDGQRLIAISGADGADGTEYRMEFDPTTRVRSYGQTGSGSGPDHWVVETKAGLTLRFGTSVDSQVHATGSHVISWTVERISDSLGNEMVFSYDDNGRGHGEAMVTRIGYTANPSQGLVAQQEVVFEYEDRPDKKTSQIAGYQVRMQTRLKTVESRATGSGQPATVRRYSLSYQVDAVTGNSQLASVREQLSDGSLLPPTTFDWSTSTPSARSLATPAEIPQLSQMYFSRSPLSFTIQGDFNGDGIMDMMQLDDHGGSTFWLAEGIYGGGFNYSAGITDFTAAEAVHQSTGNLRTGDFNADGKTDILYVTSSGTSNWLALSRGDRTFEVRRGSQLGILENLPFTFGYTQLLPLDVNGDGRTDLVVVNPSDSANRPNKVFLATANAAFVEYDPGQAFRDVRVSDSRPTYSWILPGDYNGDGLADILHLYANGPAHWLALSNGDGTFTVRDHSQLGGVTGLTFDLSFSYWVSMDINGDGLTDPVNFNDHGQAKVAVCLGDGTFAPITMPAELQGLPASNSGPTYTHMIPGDYNGDGLPDVFHAYYPASQIGWMAEPNGSGGFSVKNAGQLGVLDNKIYDTGNPPSRVFSGDFDGDGADDILHLRYAPAGNWLARSTGFAPPRVSKVTNGHGGWTSFAYKPLTDSAVHTKRGGLTYPNVDIQAPMQVVSSVTSSNGTGGPQTENTVSYRYEGAWSNLEGRGFQGFGAVESKDVTSGIITWTEYNRSNPLLGGRPVYTEQRLSGAPGGGSALISSSDSTWFPHPTVHANGKTTYFVTETSSTARSYETNRPPATALVKTVNRTGMSYDGYGNLLGSVTTILAPSEAGEYVESVSNSYADAPTPARWHLGRLTASTVTKTAPGELASSRSSTFDYHPITGLLTREIIQPGGGTLSQQKDYVHDGFGNILSSTISTEGAIARTTTTSYTPDGRFVENTWNSKGHKETKTYDPLLGNVLSQTGPNELTTSWQYDALGRPVLETRPDGTKSRSFYRKVSGLTVDAPPLAVHYVTVQSSGGAPKTVWYDLLDREIRTDSIGFNGDTVTVQKVFNERGEVVRISQPCFAGEAPLYSEMVYDAVGREIGRTDPGSRVTSTAYDGFTTAVTNPENQTVSTAVNAMGWAIRTTDAQAQSITRRYDPYGNLRFIIDPAGNTTELRYDRRGNKIWMSEPNSGTSTFNYNGFGELFFQQDSAGNNTTLTYDVLGRLVGRTEEEGNTTVFTSFEYDTAAGGVGQLAREVSAGFERRYFYDRLSRPAATVQRHGYHSFAVSRGYDAVGRPAFLTYPSGFAVRQIYTALGHLGSVKNAGSDETYWRAITVNARGQIAREEQGNGVVTDRVFDPETGLIASISAGSAIADRVQRLVFDFDDIGNLTKRQDDRFAIPFVESFGYDNLNRLTDLSTTGANAVTVAYNSIGNITYRSDVGNFSYGGSGSGPHALTGVDGGSFDKSCVYNSKGERIADGSTAIDYSSFGKPVRMRKGGETLRFDYATDRALYRQTLFGSNANGLPVQGVREYVGGLYERETGADGVVRHIHYIAGGSGVTAIHTSESGSSNLPRTRYIHKDHLGSVDVITDSSGIEVERQSFDAWGRRRSVFHNAGAWQVSYPSSPGSNETNRGFTGHEMLDAVGLVHMGGRVYDPITGRFLSPDPFVQSPENLQNLNRYSYVMNNPLSFTDPSGFFFKSIGKWIGKNWKSIVSTAIAIVAAVYAPGLLNITSKFLSAIVGGSIGSFGSAFSGTLLAGGSIGDSLRAGFRAGVIGGVQAMATYGVGKYFSGSLAKPFVHGVVGGGFSLAQGGKFTHSFMSSSFASQFSGVADATQAASGSAWGGRIAAAIVGGTADIIGGGKFGNGAMAGAFVRMFNDDLHQGSNSSQSKTAVRANTGPNGRYPFFPDEFDIETIAGPLTASEADLRNDNLESNARTLATATAIAGVVSAGQGRGANVADVIGEGLSSIPEFDGYRVMSRPYRAGDFIVQKVEYRYENDRTHRDGAPELTAGRKTESIYRSQGGNYKEIKQY